MIAFLRKTILYRVWKSLKSWLAVTLYGHPARDLYVIGVTGTNGKTTTCSLVHHMLIQLGIKAAYIGTTGVRIGTETLPGVQKMTSYDPFVLQRLLSLAKKTHCTHVVLEVSSHGLHQKRFYGIPFHIGVLTNITEEHLDYHASMDDYANQKKKLFTMVKQGPKSGRMAVLPVDDTWGKKRLQQLPFAHTVSYGLQGDASLTARIVTIGEQSTEIVVRYMSKEYHAHIPLAGAFNVRNVLAALGVLINMGYGVEEGLAALASFQPVAGRQEYYVYHDVHRYIDYAHTPHGLQVMLEYIRALAKGRVIVVFGAPGERDKQKRPLMGSTVDMGADVIIVTDDDPARENRRDILRDVVRGVAREIGDDFYVIPGRQYAIAHAARLAQPGDIVLLAGIGHQDVLDTNFGYIPWSEQEAIEKAYTMIAG